MSDSDYYTPRSNDSYEDDRRRPDQANDAYRSSAGADAMYGGRSLSDELATPSLAGAYGYAPDRDDIAFDHVGGVGDGSSNSFRKFLFRTVGIETITVVFILFGTFASK